MMQFEIRTVTPEDIPSIYSIYHESVLKDTASWELSPPGLEEMHSRVQTLLSQKYPFFVAVSATGVEQAHAGTEAEQIHKQVLGYSYASSFRARPGYRFTVEDSIYVDIAHRGLGLGEKLLTALIDACANQGYRQMVAVIGGSERLASIALHHKLGFQHVGLLPNIGLKHDRWLDCVLMQLALGVGHKTIPES